jgi:hypothetical protein
MIFDFRLLIFGMGSDSTVRSAGQRDVADLAEGSASIVLRIPNGRMF